VSYVRKDWVFRFTIGLAAGLAVIGLVFIVLMLVG